MRISIGTGQENRTRNIAIISAFILLFGILLIVLNVTKSNKAVDWVPLKAEIVNIVARTSGTSTSYDVFVKYIYNEETYPYQLLDTYESSMQIKKIIDIKVNPNNPTEFIYANDGFFNTLYIIGGCLIGVGVVMPSIWIPIKIHKRKQQEFESKEETKNREKRTRTRSSKVHEPSWRTKRRFRVLSTGC